MPYNEPGFWILLAIVAWLGFELAMWMIRWGHRFIAWRRDARLRAVGRRKAREAVARYEARRSTRSLHRSGMRP